MKSATKCNQGGEAGREEGLKRQKITRFFPCASLVTQWCNFSKCRTVNWLLLWILWNHCLSPNLWSFCVVTRPDKPTWKHSSVQIWLNKHGFLFSHNALCSVLVATISCKFAEVSKPPIFGSVSKCEHYEYFVELTQGRWTGGYRRGWHRGTAHAQASQQEYAQVLMIWTIAM